MEGNLGSADKDWSGGKKQTTSHALRRVSFLRIWENFHDSHNKTPRNPYPESTVIPNAARETNREKKKEAKAKSP